MGGSFKDHFSGHAADYAEYRPVYPERLAALLAEQSAGHALALDCGCGSGQLSVLLGGYFERVVATDASGEQIANAQPHPKVSYKMAPAEHSGLPDHCADLIVAAQAAHWFDLPAFWQEVDRVARPGGIVALVGYGLLTAGSDVDPIIGEFYNDILGPYWPSERRMVEEGYAGIVFPYRERAVSGPDMTAEWSLPQLVRYFSTWSAVKAAERTLGRSPLPAVAERLGAVWGERTRRLRWPLILRLGIVNESTRSSDD